MLPKGLIKGQKGAFWIGLKLQRHTEGDKKIISASWTDGSPLTYGNPLNLPISTKPWGPYQPDNNSITPGPELCVNMYQNVSQYFHSTEGGTRGVTKVERTDPYR
jgi:hypothetical protein